MTKHAHHIGSSLQIISVLLAHIPCCGSQILASVFGLQLLGAISTTQMHHYQYLIPIVTAALITLTVAITSHIKHRKAHAACLACEPQNKTNLGSFFAINLAIGYIVLGLLYLLIPPHIHEPINQTVPAIITKNQEIMVLYKDPEQRWPWSTRMFKANLQTTPAAKAEEIHWIEKLLKKNSFNQTNLEAGITTKPSQNPKDNEDLDLYILHKPN